MQGLTFAARMERKWRKATKNCFAMEALKNTVDQYTTSSQLRNNKKLIYTSPLEFSLDISNYLSYTPLQVFLQDLYILNFIFSGNIHFGQ